MDVLSAIKLVSSLAYRNRSYEPIGFDDEVAEYASANGIALQPKIKLVGLSGTPYEISFKATVSGVESLIETISPKNPGGIKSRVDATLRMWWDIDPTRFQGAKITLLNDDPLQFKSTDENVLAKVSKVYRWMTDKHSQSDF
jgi:hypothetical protein